MHFDSVAIIPYTKSNGLIEDVFLVQEANIMRVQGKANNVLTGTVSEKDYCINHTVMRELHEELGFQLQEDQLLSRLTYCGNIYPHKMLDHKYQFYLVDVTDIEQTEIKEDIVCVKISPDILLDSKEALVLVAHSFLIQHQIRYEK
jgi:8-oxo-dGTP pyrophosphatase MutT (NUDIX family)